MSEDQKSDEIESTESEGVTEQDARQSIAGLRLDFMQEGNEGSPVSALETCTDFVQLQSTEHSRMHSVNSSNVTNC
jgi:hypothetical protein